jgi:hypothetical protein
MRGARLLFCIIVLLSIQIKGQLINYVNNPSFEVASPNATINPFFGAEFWGSPDSTKCSSHFLFTTLPPLSNAPYCVTGFQYPRNGNNFILVSFYCPNCGIPNQRFYPRTRLRNTLKSNTKYCAKYYVVNTNHNRIAIENYGMYFGGSSNDTIKLCAMPLSYLTPQIEYSGGIITDTLNWTAISGTFTANGNEKYLYLGNFRTDVATNTLLINTPTLQVMSNDIYIDDVSVVEMDAPAYAGPDKSIKIGDSAFVGSPPDITIDETCIWYKMTSPTTSVSIDTVLGLWVKPVTTTTYVVKQQLWCSTTPKWDTVVVFMDLVGLNENLRVINEQLLLYPLPAQDFLQLKIPNEECMRDFKTLSIYDHLGREMLVSDCSFKTKTETIDTRDLPAGIYFLELKSPIGQKIRKRFVVNR